MSEDKESERLIRSKARAIIKRTTAISNIRAIHALSLRIINEPEVIPELMISVSDLDILWTRFRSEDDKVLEILLQLDKGNDYSPDLSAEVRALINASKAAAGKLTPKGAEAIDLSYLITNLALSRLSAATCMTTQ